MLGTNVALSSCGRHLYARQFIKTQAQVQAVQDFCIYEQIQALLRFSLDENCVSFGCIPSTSVEDVTDVVGPK